MCICMHTVCLCKFVCKFTKICTHTHTPPPTPQLLSTAEDVSKMQEELESMRPLLEEAARDTATTMQKIQVGQRGG